MLRGAFLEALPTLFAHRRETGREALQAGIWIVSLSTALLAYSSLAPHGLEWMSVDARRTMVLLLLGCVTLGVLYRLAILELDHVAREHRWEQMSILGSLQQDIWEPWHPDEVGNVEQIIKLCQESFHTDASYLRGPEWNLESARAVYRSHWEIHVTREREAADDLAELLLAYDGGSVAESRRLFVGDGEGGYDDARRAARSLKLRARVVTAAYIGEIISFLGALVILAVAALGR
jgi:hypothetical protein